MPAIIILGIAAALTWITVPHVFVSVVVFLSVWCSAAVIVAAAHYYLKKWVNH